MDKRKKARIMMLKKYITAKNIIIAVTFCLILVSGILTRQNPLFMIPLFVSLGVMALQAAVNRTAYLIGGINACIYGIVYICMGLYASAASALLFSSPLQLVTFLNWKRKAYGKATIFKKLTMKARIILASCAVLGFFIQQFVLTQLGSDYAILDNIASLVGIASSILSLLGYIEYIYLQILGTVLTIALNVQVTMTNPAHCTYLIYSLYCIYCLVLAFSNVRKLYKEQQEAAKNRLSGV
jgi:nicotinamide mononucleotide transporter PnuC